MKKKYLPNTELDQSGLVMRLEERLQTLQAELNFCMGTVKNYDGKINKLKAENEALKNSDFNPTFCRILIKELTTEAARLREALTTGVTPFPEFLRWVAARLVEVHDEHPNVDYALSLKERADRIEEALKPKEKNT